MIAALLPSETIKGRDPLRPASGGGLIYRHEECGGECLVWDIIQSGRLILECDCGERPTRLADELGIHHDRLHGVELDISARMLAHETLAHDPENLSAKAVLHALGPT